MDEDHSNSPLRGFYNGYDMGSFMIDDEDAYTEAIKAECARARLDWDPSKVEIYHFEECVDGPAIWVWRNLWRAL